MKGKMTNSLKPPLTKTPSEISYWELNEMPGTGVYLRQKTYRLLKVCHKFLNLWGKTMRKLWQTSKVKTGEEGIKSMMSHAQKAGVLWMRTCAYKEYMGRIRKWVIKSGSTKWIAPNKCHGIFCALVPPNTLQYYHQEGKCRCFLPS